MPVDPDQAVTTTSVVNPYSVSAVIGAGVTAFVTITNYFSKRREADKESDKLMVAEYKNLSETQIKSIASLKADNDAIRAKAEKEAGDLRKEMDDRVDALTAKIDELKELTHRYEVFIVRNHLEIPAPGAGTAVHPALPPKPEPK